MLSKPSKPLPTPLRRSLTAFGLLGLLGLPACAPLAPRVTLTVPQTFRTECAGPATDGVLTVGDLAAFSIRQAEALKLCDAKRAGVVAIVDAAAPKPRTWWPIRLPGS